MADYRVDLESIAWQSSAPGFRSKVYREGSRQIRIVEIGREFVEHEWCTKGHFGFVLEGELEIDFGGKVVKFKSGDGVFIPPGPSNKHKARATTDGARLFFVEDV